MEPEISLLWGDPDVTAISVDSRPYIHRLIPGWLIIWMMVWESVQAGGQRAVQIQVDDAAGFVQDRAAVEREPSCAEVDRAEIVEGSLQATEG